MVERRSLIVKTLMYEGLFNVVEFYNILDDWIKDKGYDRYEKLNEEIVGESGKQVRLKLRPWKKTSDYAKNVLKINARFFEVTDVMVEIEGVKKKMQKGKVEVKIEGMIETDYEGKLQNRPFYFFLREIFDRFVYRVYNTQSEGILLGDADHLWLTLRQYFNMYTSRKGVV